MSRLSHQSPDISYLPLFISQPLNNMSLQYGVPSDQLRLVLLFLLAIPLGVIHKNIPYTDIKHIYSIIFGLIYSYIIVGYSSIHLFICSTLCYILMYIKPNQPMYSTLCSMLYLSISHIYRLYIDYLGWSLDYTMLLMVAVVKLSTLAYNIYDGRLLKKHKDNTSYTLHKRSDIHKFRVSHSVDRMPSLIEFYSYIYYYGGVLVGPCYEYIDYINYTNLNMFKSDKSKNIPSTLIPSLICVSKALLCYVGVLVSGYFPVMGYINTKQFYNNNDLSFLYRLFYIWFAVGLHKFKYYFAWKLSEAGCISSGLAYNGIDNKTQQYKFNRLTNINILDVELATNFSIITNNWNIGVNNWLKHYIYFRVPYNKSIANLVTKLVSAFWHGFYSGYYLMFTTAWLVNESDTILQVIFSTYFYSVDHHNKTIKHYYSNIHKYIWITLTWCITLFELCYIACSFVLLRARWGYAAWKSIYFIGHIIPIVIVIAGKIIGKSKKSNKRVLIEQVGNHPVETVDLPSKAADMNSDKLISNGIVDDTSNNQRKYELRSREKTNTNEH